MLHDGVILCCLVDHLTIGDLFRLRRAIGRQGFSQCDNAMRYTFNRRIGWSHTFSKRNDASVASIVDAMNRPSSRRCRECGVQTHRRVRVCETCASCVGGYFSLVSRRTVASWTIDGWSVRMGAVRRILSTLVPATQRSTGEYLYWEHDARRAFATCAMGRLVAPAQALE